VVHRPHTFYSAPILSVEPDQASGSIASYYLQNEGLDVARAYLIPGALDVYGIMEECDYDVDDPENKKDSMYRT
jgi:hypothetical protein